MNEQKTLRKAVHLEGVGLHTGSNAVVDVLPAEADSGIAFTLVGDGKTVEVPATAEHVIDTSRATVIGRDGASVSTTEHLLSALLAAGVSNAEIRVQGCEIPIGDGSAR